MEKADWRKAFKKEWKEVSKRTLNNNTYLTDTNKWICGCSAFLTNRFFICKHLVLQKGTVDASFFDEVHRSHQYPFIDTISFQINFEQPTSHTLQTISTLEVVEDENLQVCKEIYDRLIDSTEKILEILKGNLILIYLIFIYYVIY